ncbi:sugar phosphate nucleotidyltransferase [Paenibacillus sp. DMB20]|uniref:sugar phosphate nucleotidyltransferase n=1 Tax=Paenibacillus sp. DMB20 TaxID=1642570 RepID=UPI000627FC85|nr:sugar phosphate nucleotidyltransferase [Paenibacillus sp. DMB20]KKO54277.1 spore coat protein [Paenibacillus sp. DMB20]
MKGVILAGGTGTRLYPLTKIINKHLLPVGKIPMICHGIEKLRNAGIVDILLVISKQSAGLYTELLGGGKEWGVHLTYKVQEEAGGIAQALSLAEPFMEPNEKFVVLLGDNLFEDPLTTYVQFFRKQAEGARVLLKQVHDPRRYGVPILEGDKIIKIEEKPAEPKSDYCVTGIYMYDTAVFDKIRSIKPSDRGELEITDVNNVYASEGQLAYDVLAGWWTDAGTFQSLHQASDRLLK